MLLKQECKNLNRHCRSIVFLNIYFILSLSLSFSLSLFLSLSHTHAHTHTHTHTHTQEADNWVTLVDDVEDVFATQDIDQVLFELLNS